MSIAFSPSGTYILSDGVTGAACVWDITTGQQILVLEGDTDIICSVAYSPNGLLIATGSFDSKVRLWDAEDGRQLAVLHGHDEHVESVAFTADGTSLVSGSRDSTIRVWDIAKAQEQFSDDVTDLAKAVERTGLRDGWLLGEARELLLWVPKVYRAYLNLPSCRILIGRRRVEIKTVGKLHHGENWTECWVGDRS